jgi:hypothetical protein
VVIDEGTQDEAAKVWTWLKTGKDKNEDTATVAQEDFVTICK